ncbi:MAG: chemotaxis response regulator protein-glutamate methylesterase [Candidatus Eremiobacteraeota bacterium]|nr:chemotaxis response regulator protein-glutamate methylesterase [Candidatus Eremiobacteraeota bacterium]
MKQTIDVLVVDDSAFMRQAISQMLESEPQVRVVGTARTGEEALVKAAQLRPDVVTMDVEMPGMGGLEAVRQLAADGRIAVVMVSSLTREGAETTFRALELGALDFIAKPDAAYANIKEVARDLVAKVRALARRAVAPSAAAGAVAGSAAPRRSAKTLRSRFECVAVGTSTGGPVALARVVPLLPSDFPMPILIVQHMPVGFTRPLANHLNGQSRLHVSEATGGEILQSGTALVIPSGRQVRLVRSLREVELRLVDDDGRSLHVPSVDVLAEQVADAFGAQGVGVILTGMGQDGVKGLRKLKSRGGYVIGQDESTSVVYGMPRAAADAGLVDRVVPLGEVAQVLSELAPGSNHTNS